MHTNKEAGQVSRLLLVLAAIVLVAVIITFLVMKLATKAPTPITPTPTTVQLPVYDKSLGNVEFNFEYAMDLGNDLRAANAVNPAYNTQQDLITSERFVEVAIGAKNNGTANTDQGAWDIGDIVDSNGRHFIPKDTYLVAPWLPAKNLCGAILSPAFNPTLCIKIYEVARVSTGLKVMVETGKDNQANNFSAGKIDSFPLDLIVK